MHKDRPEAHLSPEAKPALARRGDLWALGPAPQPATGPRPRPGASHPRGLPGQRQRLPHPCPPSLRPHEPGPEAHRPRAAPRAWPTEQLEVRLTASLREATGQPWLPREQGAADSQPWARRGYRPRHPPARAPGPASPPPEPRDWPASQHGGHYPRPAPVPGPPPLARSPVATALCRQVGPRTPPDWRPLVPPRPQALALALAPPRARALGQAPQLARVPQQTVLARRAPASPQRLRHHFGWRLRFGWPAPPRACHARGTRSARDTYRGCAGTKYRRERRPRRWEHRD